MSEGQRAMINRLRVLAGLTPFGMNDPSVKVASLEDIIGKLRVRVANTVVGEASPTDAEIHGGAPEPGQLKTAFRLTVDRESKEYKSVLKKLESLGVGDKGAAGGSDRAMVADALFAQRSNPNEIPRLTTFDYGVYLPLAEAFAPVAPQYRSGMKGSQERKDEAVVRAYHKTGFTVEIDDDFNSKYKLTIFPASEQYWDPR